MKHEKILKYFQRKTRITLKYVIFVKLCMLKNDINILKEKF